VVHYSKPVGAAFPETKITPRRRSTPLHKNSDKARELMDGVPDFDELFSASRRTPEQVQEILDRYLAADDESGVTEEKTDSPKKANEVDKAFNELLGT
jgi:hypothetical protein